MTGWVIMDVIGCEVECHEKGSYRPDNNADFDEGGEGEPVLFSKWILNWRHSSFD